MVGLIAVFIALAFNAPMLPRMSEAMPEVGFGDPFLTAWMVAWDGHALTDPTAHIWDSNTFWPWDDTLAFSDALLGYAPAGLIGDGIEAAIVRHNLLYLFAHAFAFFGAYLLARELGVTPLAALVAAAAFAYAPWRLDQRTHLHVISSGGIPMTMLLFARGYRRRRPLVIVAAALVGIWQISLGFTLGIPLGYALGVLAIVGLVVHRFLGTEPLGRNVIVASACAAAIMAGWVAWQAAPYYRVVDDHPEARRKTTQVDFFSSPLGGLVTSPRANFAWGGVTQPLRNELNWPTEQSLFPGVTAIGLAVLGLTSRRERWVRLLFGLGVLACLYLSMGLAAPVAGIYRLLYDVVPGWEGIRVPGRLMVLTSLGLGCLAAIGCQDLIDRASSLETTRRHALALIAVIPVLVLVEGAGTVEVNRVPVPPASIDLVDGPRAHIPTNDLTDRIYMLWSIDGFYPIANGESGFVPESVAELRTSMPLFPDETSVALLRELDVRSVVFHPDMVDFEISSLLRDTDEPEGPEIDEPGEVELQRMATADITGLGLTREIHDDAIIFYVDG